MKKKLTKDEKRDKNRTKLRKKYAKIIRLRILEDHTRYAEESFFIEDQIQKHNDVLLELYFDMKSETDNLFAAVLINALNK